jgi:uracil-DNA glycosylase family 4
MTANDQNKLRRIVVDRLESLQQAGVLQLPKVRSVTRQFGGISGPPTETEDAPAESSRESVKSEVAPARANNLSAKTEDEMEVAASPNKIISTPAAATSLFEVPAANSKVAADMTLEVLQQQVASCTRCSELASTRTQTVFGVGNSKARLCFLGEAPGADEDKTGIPFVGRGGQLLTKIIEACKLKREDVYILNMIKCRPPGNRNPLPLELGNCRGFLESQLDLIQPEFICCLGAVASQNLLGTTVAIGKLRGKLHSFRGIKVICTYHPAFLLRSPSFKKEAWEDMKFLMRQMGVEL